MSSIEDAGVIEREAIARENQRLKSLLRSVLKEARHNEAALRKFQRLELCLLNIAEPADLLNRLQADFKAELELDAVSLYLFDPCNSVRELLSQAESNAPEQRLVFCKEQNNLLALYNGIYVTQLWQRNEALARRLFGHGSSVLSLAMLPLVRNGVLIGSYHLGSRDAARFSAALSTDFYDHLAQIISVCLENTVNRSRLEYVSQIDPLTKTRNRRSLYESLRREISRCYRDSTPLSCLFFDLDHFKTINDGFGHPTGDKALQTIAHLIGPNLRNFDTLARFGGEEFTAVLPNCDAGQVQKIAERIRRIVEATELTSIDGKKFRITCSIGCTTWQPDSQPRDQAKILDHIIKTADDAAYAVKAAGRNAFIWKPLSV